VVGVVAEADLLPKLEFAGSGVIEVIDRVTYRHDDTEGLVLVPPIL
jgi:hypothetical protein